MNTFILVAIMSHDKQRVYKNCRLTLASLKSTTVQKEQQLQTDPEYRLEGHRVASCMSEPATVHSQSRGRDERGQE